MSWEIKYKSKWDQKTYVHKHTLNESGARGWADSLSREHGCEAEVTHVADGPYDHSGKRAHVYSVGDDTP